LRSTPAHNFVSTGWHVRSIRAAAAGLAATSILVAGCSVGGDHRAAGPTTTLITVDRWTAPTVNGAGTDSFCSVVTSVYQHMAQLPLAADNRIRSQFVGDYVSTAPAMVAAAPPAVAADAKLYFTSVAQILAALRNAGLDARRIAGSRVGSILLDPTVKAAGNNVIAFVQGNCHYTIGS
jgi:hypothetical protein